jgi:hypothetical protein
MAEMRPVTDEQWRLLRNRMEMIAEGNERSPRWAINPVEMAELMLFLMDRIDQLQQKIDAA